jgi:hypothetical protein
VGAEPLGGDFCPIMLKCPTEMFDRAHLSLSISLGKMLVKKKISTDTRVRYSLFRASGSRKIPWETQQYSLIQKDERCFNLRVHI